MCLSFKPCSNCGAEWPAASSPDHKCASFVCKGCGDTVSCRPLILSWYAVDLRCDECEAKAFEAAYQADIAEIRALDEEHAAEVRTRVSRRISDPVGWASSVEWWRGYMRVQQGRPQFLQSD